MVKALGAALDGGDEAAAKARVRDVLEHELSGVAQSPGRKRAKARLLLVAAALALASLSGIAIAQDDGAGVDAPAAEKIPFVRERLEELELELASLDTSSAEGVAKAAYMQTKIDEVRRVLEQLCIDAGRTAGC